jgi:hypothetical protein
MTAGMRGGGFFVGGVGGLALALLLVGVVSFLPPSNTALRAGSAQATNAAGGASATSVASSTTTVFATSSALETAANLTQNNSQTPQAAVTATTTVTATATNAIDGEVGAASTTTAAGASAPSRVAGLPSGAEQTPRPGSLLSALPGESVASLIATISPLLVGLVVAVLIYGAYSRRQDSSS